MNKTTLGTLIALTVVSSTYAKLAPGGGGGELISLRDNKPEFHNQYVQPTSFANWPFQTLFYRVTDGESLASIAEQFYFPGAEHALLQWNPDAGHYDETTGALHSTVQSGYYLTLKNLPVKIAEKNDTVEMIALARSVQLDEFLKLNSHLGRDLTVGEHYLLPRNAQPTPVEIYNSLPKTAPATKSTGGFRGSA